MPQEIRVVLTLPHEDQVCSGHEQRDERAADRGTGERIRADAEPTAVISGVVLPPELLVGVQLLVEKASMAWLQTGLLHDGNVAVRFGPTSGTLCIGVRETGPPPQSGRTRARFSAHTGPRIAL